MKTILIMANATGGLYIFRKKLIEALIRAGYRVIVLSAFTSRMDKVRELGVTLIETPFERRGTDVRQDYALYRTYVRYLKEYRPDYLITYTIKPNIYGGLAAQKCHVPYSANITGLGTAFQGSGAVNRLVTFLYKRALRKAENVFFENKSNRDVLLDKRIVREGQCTVLSGAGVDLDDFTLLEYPKDNPVNFVFIGRIMREKGADELFEVARRLAEEGKPIHLTLVGDREERYQEQIEKAQAAGWLDYAGYVTDVIPYIRSAHCAVLPSYHEGMSNTNLECAASGRPLITSDIPGCREAVIDGKTGFLCRAKDADSLYEAMKKMAALSPEDREQMGLKGRKHMEDRFDKQKVVRQTLEALNLGGTD